MQIKRIAALAAVSVAAVAGSAAPASAHTVVAVFTGTATTSGTWLPVSPFCPTNPTITTVNGTPVGPCQSANTWSFTSTTDIVIPPGSVSGGRVSGAGTFNGWCGHSQGAGVATVDGDTGNISWVSAGTIIVLTGSGAPGHTAAVAVVAARAAAGTGNCFTAPATNFDVVGVAVVV